MDDVYETPTAIADNVDVSRAAEGEDVEDAESSGGEDMPDWGKFATSSSAAAVNRPIIPKRGDKEFEPAAGGPTGLQSYSLDRSRNAMFDALRAERGISSKSVTYGIWRPSMARVEVIQARGTSFNTMGHSWAPTASVDASIRKQERCAGALAKKLCLLPEEALYLIERGSMFCWERTEGTEDEFPLGAEEGEPQGTPMSVQQAFANMIGKEDLSMERYQVFAHLKRLGYTVTRARPPSSSPLYPRPPSMPLPTFLSRLHESILVWVRSWKAWLVGLRTDWWRPFHFTAWGNNTTYPSIFRLLRIVPSGHSIPLRTQSPNKPASPPHNDVSPTPISPYTIFYHIWKPSTPWRKTNVPPADFEVIVVNANTTLLPTLPELASVFGALPRQGLAPPRKRFKPGQQPRPPAPPPEERPLSVLTRTKILLGLLPKPKSTAPKPNPFAALKAGSKSVIIAAVDGGSISFIRFAEGCFEEWPVL